MGNSLNGFLTMFILKLLLLLFPQRIFHCPFLVVWMRGRIELSRTPTQRRMQKKLSICQRTLKQMRYRKSKQ